MTKNDVVYSVHVIDSFGIFIIIKGIFTFTAICLLNILLEMILLLTLLLLLLIRKRRVKIMMI